MRFFFQNNHTTVFSHQIHFHIAFTRHGDGFFTVIEVTVGHVRDVGTGSVAPFAHFVRVVARITFNRRRGTPVRVTFTQYRVNRTTEHARITLGNGFFFIRLWVIRVFRHHKTFRAQFFDSGIQLREGSTDIRQLDNIGSRVLSQTTKFGEVIGDALIFV